MTVGGLIRVPEGRPDGLCVVVDGAGRAAKACRRSGHPLWRICLNTGKTDWKAAAATPAI